MATHQGIITYSLNEGNFQGIIDMGSLPSNVYLLKVTLDQYLHKTLPGIQQITSATINTIPPVSLVTGDINNDNLLSISDYNLLIDCYSDLSPAKNCSDQIKKRASDLTDDGAVNQFDYNLFLRELSVQTGQ